MCSKCSKATLAKSSQASRAYHNSVCEHDHNKTSWFLPACFSPQKQYERS